MRQEKPLLKIAFIIISSFMIFFKTFGIAEEQKIHKENGEEVYIPKEENKNPEMKQMTIPSDKKNAKSNEKTSGDQHSNETKQIPPKMDSKDSGHGSSSENKNKLLEKYKGNKLVNNDNEEAFEVHKPYGLIWFAGVFVVLLIVIFVFT